jgi:hypothetical protein
LWWTEKDFELETQPTYTYKLNMETDRIRGCVEGLEAMKQAIYKMLLTERYQYIIYSWDYGIETLDLYGEPATFVCPELERRISEALLVDERIESVSDFEFDTSQKGVVNVAFTAHTIFGDAEVESEVNI